MTAAPTPSRLATFSHDNPAWIGGDIRRLSEFAGELYGYAPQIDDVASALDAQVNGMVSAAQWQGTAASTFKSSWEQDSVTAQGIAKMAVRIGQIIDKLAVSLSQIESGLETDAEFARSHGVQIGPQGQPPAQTSAFSSYATGYSESYDGAMQQAQKARQNAINELVQYNGPNHTLANQVFGTAGFAAAWSGYLLLSGGLSGWQSGGLAGALSSGLRGVWGSMTAGAGTGAELAENLADAVGAALPVDTGLLGTLGGYAAIGVGGAAGFVAVPLAVTFVGVGVGDFVAGMLESGGNIGQSVDNAVDADREVAVGLAKGVGEVAKDAAVGVGHEVEHLFDDL